MILDLDDRVVVSSKKILEGSYFILFLNRIELNIELRLTIWDLRCLLLPNIRMALFEKGAYLPNSIRVYC